MTDSITRLDHEAERGREWLEQRTSETPEQAVARLAALSPMEYDKVRETEAETLGVRVSTLDAEVKAARKADEAAGGATMTMDDPEPWPEPVDGAALLTEIAETIDRFMVMPSPAVTATALWVVHSHAHDAARVSPILAVTSPQKRCGKTTLLTLLNALVRRPLPASNITAAALFRAVEKWAPALLIDEADTFLRDSDDLRGVINSGHNRAGAFVIRTVGDEHEPRAFSTWAPKAIALIGNLPDTLADRSVAVELRRKTAREPAEPLRVDRLRLDEVQARCTRWAADHDADLRHGDPEIPAGLNDRMADNWRCLLAIADAAGGEWPERARAALVAMQPEDGDDAAGVMLLEDIQEVIDRRDKIGSAELVAMLTAREDRPWCEWRGGRPITPRQIAKLLKPFGIKPRQVRIGESNVQGYRRGDFDDAFARYLGAQNPTSLQPRHDAVSSRSRNPTPVTPVGDGKPPEPAPDGDCRDVGDSNPHTDEVHV